MINKYEGEQNKCTCPSGDGSLRWPCPSHPPEEVEGVGYEKARELLAAAYSDAGCFSVADRLLRTAYVRDAKEVVALRAIEKALAQQPASDGGFTAADMMDARQEGRKEGQQHAAVDGALVHRALAAYEEVRWAGRSESPPPPRHVEAMRAALTAALAAAAKDAEIAHERWLREQAENRCVAVEDQREALRAEVERLREVSRQIGRMCRANNLAAVEAEAHAEQLAEALRAEIPVLRRIAGFGNMSDEMTDEVADRLEAALREQES